MYARIIMINGASTNIIMNPCSVVADLISAQFCNLYNISTEGMPLKYCVPAIQGFKCTITKAATIEVDRQLHEDISTFHVSNLMDCNALVSYPMLHHFNAGLNVKHNSVHILCNDKMKY